jgi:hypothetical protein
MRVPWRPLALAVALNVTVVVGVAKAQTVIVTNAPPGSTVELALNADTLGSATADPHGAATLAVNLSAHGGKTQTDVRIYVDVCSNLRRVLLVEQSMPPPPLKDGCVRKEIPRLFLLSGVTTLVVDVSQPAPAVWLRQGPVPAEWLSQEPQVLRAARARENSPTGLVLFGGGDLAKFRDAVKLGCGDVGGCAGTNFRVAYSAGAAYWFTRFLAAEASYVKPSNATFNGSGDNFRFNGYLDARVVTVTGKVGVPIGRVRLYGQAGVNYHQETSSTTQTIDDSVVTVDSVTTTIKGGTQTFTLKTAGWGWLFGGGVEIWAVPKFAVYAEGGRARLNGADLNGGEARIDDRVTFILVGARVRIGGPR